MPEISIRASSRGSSWYEAQTGKLLGICQQDQWSCRPFISLGEWDCGSIETRVIQTKLLSFTSACRLYSSSKASETSLSHIGFSAWASCAPRAQMRKLVEDQMLLRLRRQHCPITWLWSWSRPFRTQKSDLSLIPSSSSQASSLIPWSLLSLPIVQNMGNLASEAQWSHPCSSGLLFHNAKTLGNWGVCFFGFRTQGSLYYLGSSISRV
jgi:hypothetical protein